MDQIENYYDQYKFPDWHRFYDWAHAETGAEVLKAQHPEFETRASMRAAASPAPTATCRTSARAR